MGTPSSAVSSYAVPDDLLAAFDARVVGQLVADDDTQLDPIQLRQNPVLAQVLQMASGEVEAACTVAGRYLPADLAGLTGNSQQYLVRMVCCLALGYLIERRAYADRPVPPSVEWARGELQKLREGERIFGITEAQLAGIPRSEIQTADQLIGLGLLSWQARRAFGIRSQYLRNGRTWQSGAGF